MAKIFRKALYVDKSKLYSSDFVPVEKRLVLVPKRQHLSGLLFYCEV